MDTTQRQRPRKYSAEFKREAVDRFVKGESATVIARELGMRRKFLYAWRDAGLGSNGIAAKPPRTVVIDEKTELRQELAKQQQKIADLERLIGQQTAELDFFAAALQAIKESPLSKKVSSDAGSTRRSKA